MARYRYRKTHGWTALISLLIAVVWTLAQTPASGRLSMPSAIIKQSQPGLYAINHFVDGDTIAVDMNGQPVTVRMIGVDTPETHKPNTPVQCYGPAAAAYTKSIIGQSRVRLEADPLTTDRDRYDRLLRYVYLPADSESVNEKLIKNGYGFYYPYFPFTKAAQFRADQTSAQTAHRGLWANCTPQPTDGGGYLSNPA